MQRLLIIGAGDVARRTLPLLLGRYRIYALLRRPAAAAEWRRAGVIPVQGDLDDRASLRRLAGLADLVLYLAPPPERGEDDPRCRRLLAALSQSESLPRHLIYVGTTGIYGDCRGEWLDETRRPAPQTPRARRRLAAEMRLRDFGRRSGCRVSLLRAPGIYAAERLPRERLLAGTPTLCPEDDVFTNHIHADDLAAACVAALRRGRANRVYNAVDSGEMRLGEYFDAVAAALGLPPPPRLPRSELAEVLSPVQLSFMAESRRIRNRRLCQELQLRLRYPTVGDTLASLPPSAAY